MAKKKRKVTRTYQPNRNEWGNCTAVGRIFYSRARTSYIVRVPDTNRGTRSSGTPYTRDNGANFPTRDPIILPYGLPLETRDDRIKAHIIALYNNQPIASFSDEEITLRADGEWDIQEMITTPAVDGQTPVTEVSERPLGAEPE